MLPSVALSELRSIISGLKMNIAKIIENYNLGTSYAGIEKGGTNSSRRILDVIRSEQDRPTKLTSHSHWIEMGSSRGFSSIPDSFLWNGCLVGLVSDSRVKTVPTKVGTGLTIYIS